MKTIIAPLSGSAVVVDLQEAYLAALTKAARVENAALHRNSKLPIGDKGSREHKEAQAKDRAAKASAREKQQQAIIRRIKSILSADAKTAPELGRMMGIEEKRIRSIVMQLAKEGILHNVAKTAPAMWQVVK